MLQASASPQSLLRSLQSLTSLHCNCMRAERDDNYKLLDVYIYTHTHFLSGILILIFLFLSAQKISAIE